MELVTSITSARGEGGDRDGGRMGAGARAGAVSACTRGRQRRAQARRLRSPGARGGQRRRGGRRGLRAASPRCSSCPPARGSTRAALPLGPRLHSPIGLTVVELE